MPPSQPYYDMAGAFREAAESGITKRLVFSSWRVVPKVVAGIVSYEAERNMIRSFSRRAKNTPAARKRRPGLLRFGVSRTPAGHGDGGSHSATRVGGYGDIESGNEDARLTGMPVLGLMYPAMTLAKACDPLSIARELVAEGTSRSKTGLPSEQEVRERAEEHIRDLLSKIPGIGDRKEDAVVDEAWYWAAPMLLDRDRAEDDKNEWFVQEHLASIWSDFVEEDAESSNWARHVAQARRLYETEFYEMGALGRPPEDLASVLASLALGGPAICVLRALMRVAPGAEDRVLRNCAARVAWHLRSLFNLPEATNLIRSMGEEGEPYWRSVLGYSVAGSLQSVLDEYAHTLKEFRGDPNATARGVAASMCASLSLQAVNISVDHYDLGTDGAAPDGRVESSRGTMRNRFALRFGDGRSDEGRAATRASQVRQAFNSPFWPFVVATTSVGQEGLDFHTYCHAVVHWNLPSNPVDLEQREGRVHRYKNHAVRKNVAQAYGLRAMNDSYDDPWDALFDLATTERAPDASDMVPYWIYSEDGGARIERHVPALPLTRDRKLLGDLRRSLAAYRMVFGQARQEDLLAYLLDRFTEEEVDEYAEVLRMDLEPPRSVPEGR